MAGLDPAIHAVRSNRGFQGLGADCVTWMPGTSPGIGIDSEQIHIGIQFGKRHSHQRAIRCAAETAPRGLPGFPRRVAEKSCPRRRRHPRRTDAGSVCDRRSQGPSPGQQEGGHRGRFHRFRLDLGALHGIAADSLRKCLPWAERTSPQCRNPLAADDHLDTCQQRPDGDPDTIGT